MVFTFYEENLHHNAKEIKYIITDSNCWECVSHNLNKDGYPIIHRHNKFYKLSRYMYELVKGELIEGQEILHLCDNPRCINPDHLKQGTHLENMCDMKNKGRQKSFKGSDNKASTISEKEAYEIKFLAFSGIIHPDIVCELYNISKGLFQHIRKERAWKHIHCDYKGKDYTSIPKEGITYKEIKMIKQLLKDSNLTQREIAQMFNVTQSYIAKINIGKLYSWVD